MLNKMLIFPWSRILVANAAETRSSRSRWLMKEEDRSFYIQLTSLLQLNPYKYKITTKSITPTSYIFTDPFVPSFVSPRISRQGGYRNWITSLKA